MPVGVRAGLLGRSRCADAETRRTPLTDARGPDPRTARQRIAQRESGRLSFQAGGCNPLGPRKEEIRCEAGLISPSQQPERPGRLLARVSMDLGLE